MKFVKKVDYIGNNLNNANISPINHVALTGTENYLPWIGVTMTSIVEHNKGNIIFHLFVDQVGAENLGKLKEFVDRWNSSIYLYYMDDELLSEYCRFTRYLIDGRYVAALMYRFIIPDVVQGKAERILYLDGDVVCNGNILDFMNVNMDGCSVAVSEDYSGKQYAQRLHIAKYFNSGVLLIDVNRWNQDKLTEKIMKRIKEESELNPELPCPDQDILNIYLDNKALFVSHKYNMPYRLVQPSFFKAKIENEDAMQASLVHFIGAIKPWTTYNQSVPIVKVWAQAKANSPWKDVPLHAPSSQKAIHQAARDARRRHCFGEMMEWYVKFLKSKIDGTRKVGY